MPPTTPITSDPSDAELVDDYQTPVATEDVDQAPMSDAERGVLDTDGWPDRFIILFSDELLSDGATLPTRLETWYYDELAYEIVFRNGEVFTEQRFDETIEVDGLTSTELYPEMFHSRDESR